MTEHEDRAKNYFSKLQLKIERGWTDKLIRAYLPRKPDWTRKIYGIRNKEEHLFKKERIAEIEALPEFQADYETAQANRARGKKAAATVREMIIEQARTCKISIIPISDKNLLRKAIEAYNQRRWRRLIQKSNFNPDFYNPATEHSTEKFLNRIQVNYIRHNLTSYDYLLKQNVRKIGGREAIIILQTRVYEKIAETYPRFKAEVEEQMEARNLKAKTAKVTATLTDNIKPANVQNYG